MPGPSAPPARGAALRRGAFLFAGALLGALVCWGLIELFA